MVKAVIFDMDGTVVDTLQYIAYFANKALEKYALPTIPTETYKILIGNGIKNLVHKMIECVGGTPEQETAVYAEYKEDYENNFLYLAEPYAGVMKMLEDLRSAGIRTGILSNKPDSTTKKISAALFGNLIDTTYGGREGIPLKPDPQALIALLEEWDLRPEDCLYVGDTGTDMLVGKAAGMFSVGVLWGFRGEEELRKNGADAIVSTPDQIVQIALSH